MSGAGRACGIAFAVRPGTIVQPRSTYFMKDATPPMAGDSLTSTRSALALAESSEPEQPQQAEWLRYLAAVRRFGWLVLAVTLSAAGLRVRAAVVLAPSYGTQVIVWLR